VVIALICFFAFPQFESPNPQTKKMVLRRRYWLYYALQFMSGARRQIFVVFAAFMMVERFGFEVHEITALFMGTLLANMIAGAASGLAVSRFGERLALIVRICGAGAIFLLYAGIYVFDWGVVMAAALYVLEPPVLRAGPCDQDLFPEDRGPRDIAPTAAVAFTINHIAAVFLPAALGYLWLSPRSRSSCWRRGWRWSRWGCHCSCRAIPSRVTRRSSPAPRPPGQRQNRSRACRPGPR
jgi:MFS family permease